MSHLELKKLSTEWSPANYQENEANTALFPISSGEYVVGAAWRVVTVFGENTVINFGDSASEVGFDQLAAGTCNAAAFTQADGADLVNSFGKLYTSDDTIDCDYTAGDTPAAGKMRFYIVKGRIEP